MAASSSDPYRPSTSSASAAVTLVEPSRRRRPRHVLRLFRSLCRTLPLFTLHCRLPPPPANRPPPNRLAPQLSLRHGLRGRRPNRDGHPIRRPAWPRLPLDAGEPSVPTHPGGGASPPDPGAPPRDGLRHGPHRPRVREAAPRQGPLASLQAARGAALDRVLQQEEERLRHAARGERRGPDRDGDFATGVDGCRGAPGEVRRRGVRLHALQLRARYREPRLQDAVHGHSR